MYEDYPTLVVPNGRANDVGMLLDYMGWGCSEDGDEYTRHMSDEQIDAANEVWSKVGCEPHYSYQHFEGAYNTKFIFWPHENGDHDVMIEAAKKYLDITTPFRDIHFTIGNGPLSGRWMFFYDGHGDNARRIGSVFHKLDGWWEAHI